MFGIHGLGGFIVLVLVLVACLIGLSYQATVVQQDNATNYYTIEQHEQSQIKEASN